MVRVCPHLPNGRQPQYRCTHRQKPSTKNRANTQTPRKHRRFRMVASQGLEPQQAESESAVLPLHHEAISLALSVLAGSTGLEPATPGSTVQCANQLRHNPVFQKVMRSISYFVPLAQGGVLSNTDYKCPRASRLRRAAVDICKRFCATRPCRTACSRHDKPPDGMPTGTDRTHSAGRPTARCNSKRQELARDVPAGQFVESEGDPPGE